MTHAICAYELTKFFGIRKQIGYVPGDLTLYERLTGREMLEYLANLRGGVKWKNIDGLAERFDLDLSRPIKELSKGSRQKVGLVQAFMHSPKLLILDEPTAGLDPIMRLEFFSLVRELADAGNTVFFSSHILSEIERVAGRVGIISYYRQDNEYAE